MASAAQAHRVAVLLGAVLALALGATGTAYASWGVGLIASSTGEASAGAAPAAPSGVASACTSPLATTVTVTWSPAAKATSYSVWESTTSATSGYAIAAAGIAGPSWTSGNLAAGSYWFEVSSATGTAWTSANSAATAKRTILLAACN